MRLTGYQYHRSIFRTCCCWPFQPHQLSLLGASLSLTPTTLILLPWDQLVAWRTCCCWPFQPHHLSLLSSQNTRNMGRSPKYISKSRKIRNMKRMINFLRTMSGNRQISVNLTKVMLPPISILPMKSKLSIVRTVDVNIEPTSFQDVPPRPTPVRPRPSPSPSSTFVCTPAYRRRPPTKPPTQNLAWCFVRDPITGEFKQTVWSFLSIIKSSSSTLKDFPSFIYS